jgi:hypothetical protein
MSYRRDSNLKNFPGSLPRVESPEELDRKILAEARRLAPEPKRRILLSGWTPVAATAFTVAVAFVIVRPVLIDDEPETMTDQVTTLERKLNSAKVTKSEANLVAPASISENDEMSLQPEETKSHSKSVQASNKPEITASSMVIQSDTTSMSLQEQPAKEKSALSGRELSDLFEQIESLVSAGKIEEAKTRLQDLRKACPECKIPESMMLLERE